MNKKKYELQINFFKLYYSPAFRIRVMSKSSAKVGEEIILEANLSDQYDNAGVDFKIYKDGADVEKDKPVAIVKGQNKGGKAEAKWRYNYVHDPENPLTKKPKFFFQAWSFKCEKKKSGNIEFGEDLICEIMTSTGQIVKNLKYTLYKTDGSTKEGNTGEEGKIEEKDLIPGSYTIEFKTK